MNKLYESSLSDLYQSAVDAYPKTTLRQHATQPVVITQLHWTPYVGMKTLFVKGIAQNEGKEYSPIILFKNINFDAQELPEIVQLFASNGQLYEFEQLSIEKTQTVVRCNCPDFRWRFAYYNHVDESLYGRKPAKYERTTNRPPANPSEMPGMCKHLIKMQEVLQQTNLFKEISVSPS